MANGRIKGITIELNGDTTGLTDALKDVNKESSKVTSELKEVERALKFDPSNTELIAQKQQLLAEQIQNTSQKLDVLKQAQQQVEQQFANGDIGAEQYRAFQRELATTEASLRSLQGQMDSTSQNYDSLRNANRDLQTFFDATGTTVNDFSDVLGTRLTNAIREGTASTDQINRALQIMGQHALGAGADIDQMREALRRAAQGTDLNGVRQDLARITQEANQAEEAVNGFGQKLAGVAAGLAAGGGIALALEQALALDTLDTQIDISMNLNEEDAAKVRQSIMETASILGDEEAAYEGIRRQITLNKDASIEANTKIVEGARAVSFAYKEIDFKELIQETHEIGKELGITQQEALAMTNSLLSIGFPPEQLDIIAEYGSQLKRAGFNAQEIQAIMEAGVKTGTWNIDILLDGLKEGRIVAAEFGQGVDKAMKEAIKGTNISAEELEKWGQAVATGGKEGEEAMNQMITALMGVENETKRNELGVKMFGTLWEEVGPSIAQTLQTYKDNMRTSKENTDQLNETVGKLDDSTMANLAEATANLKTAIAPLLITIAELVTKIVNWIAENPKLTASLVAIASVIGTIVAAFATLMPAIGSLISILGGGATAAGLFGGALTILTGPVGLTIAAIAGFTAGVVLLYKKWDEFRELSPAIQGAIAMIAPGIVAVTGAIKAVQGAMSPAMESVDLFGTGVSEATAKAVGGYLDLETQATNAMHRLAWGNETITQSIADDMIAKYAQMGQMVLTEMQTDHAAQLAEQQKFFAESSVLSTTEETQILERLKQKQAAEELATIEGNARIKEIWQTAANEKRGITEDESAQIDLINAKMKENAVKHLSESEREQKLILERLKTDSSAITATQAAEVVKNSEKQRKDSVAAAEKQYDETVMNLQMQRDELGIISEEQYQKLKEDAEKTRDDVVKSANDMHQNVVSEAKAQAGEHVEKVNWETGEVKSKFKVMSEDLNNSMKKAGKWISDEWDKAWKATKKFTDDTKKNVGDGFKTMGTEINGLMQSIGKFISTEWDKAVKTFDPKKMISIGKDVVNGLIKGIGDKFGGVQTKIEELASKIPDWAKKTLGIHSPSRVMAEVGMWTGEGLAQGIESTYGRNESAMKELSQLLVDTTKSNQAEVTKIADEAEKERTKIQQDAAKKKLEIENKLGVDLKKANNAISTKKKGASANDNIKIQQLKENANAKLLKLEQDTQEKLKKVNDKAWSDMVKKEEQASSERLKVLKQYIADKDSSNELSLATEQHILEQSLKLFKDGTAEKIKVQKMYKKVTESINKEKESIDKTYVDNVKKLNDDYIKEEERLTKVYEDEFEKRRNAYYSFAGLFDEVAQRDVTGAALIAALQSQVTAFEDWQKNIASLASKGINEGLLAELQAMGPKAGAEIAALNTLTEEQLAEYTGLWKAKNELARTQTESELTELKQNTEKQINELKIKTSEQLRIYQNEWRNSMIALKGNVKTEMAEMPNIGVFAVSGLIEGMMSKQGDLLNAAQSLAAIVSSAFTTALDIHSPSRVMRGYGVNIGEGLVLGINDMVRKVEGATRRLAKAVTDKSTSSLPNNSVSSTTTNKTENNTENHYNFTVNSPKPLDPYETSRLNKNALKEMGLQF
ncbi:hypothetical protein [Lysinibacillus varians]|uniref:Phage tail tape measure protein n=1 Tax=Lysinibacillus varians TaxID=1145276 RepID=A0ABY2T9H9_9BACI|nr:hypothetical protein [Lysinibacillus varians]AHN22038.1 hypothetical protein T479_12205 [Lysinibacillus varians]TKI52669.1 hypothetical protein FC752_18980 [Lysinibacillus varians]